MLRRTFQRVWRLGIPVVVRGVRRGFDWAPQTMLRATRETGNKSRGTERDTTLEVGLSPSSSSRFPAARCCACWCGRPAPRDCAWWLRLEALSRLQALCTDAGRLTC